MSAILLRAIMGDCFDAMPQAVKDMHTLQSAFRVHGTSRIMGGNNPLAWAIRAVAQLPKPQWRAPIHIDFTKNTDGSEQWDRHFGASRFNTRMTQEGPYLVETLIAFPVAFVYRVDAGPKGFSLYPEKIRFIGISLPRLLWPSLAARASEWKGRYRFSTYVGFWFCGRVISYFGYLDRPNPS
jgi:hypothetical protein